ncbi:glycosyltransferase family 61 protein [Lactococcus sp. dk322]|nr:DUF563 domain-containing protein [Lactococcus sp. dk101]TXK44965.1 glycosyltransferase family 61 protein [Lactococcus sp. dk310]TXK51254.1 glycosyltransferase family 61 protein [Lactococcus sp. dk322]
METKYLDSVYLDDFVLFYEKKMSNQTPLKFEQLSDGVLIPLIEKQGMAYAGVLNASSEIVSSANFEPLNHLDGYGLSAEIMEEINLDNLSFMEGSFIYLGRIQNHWGHFLMDSVSRLWPVLENENKNIGKEQFIYFGEEIKSQSIIRFFELLGINKTQLHYISRPTRFSQLTVPQAAFIPGKMVHEKFLLPFNQIIKQLKLPENQQPTKIYLSRAKLKGINEWGEPAIEKCFEKNGFQIIYPETLNLDEQIKWLQSADTIACLSGTLAHTLVFAKQATRLIVINKSYKRENYRQSGIDEIKNFKLPILTAIFR